MRRETRAEQCSTSTRDIATWSSRMEGAVGGGIDYCHYCLEVLRGGMGSLMPPEGGGRSNHDCGWMQCMILALVED